MRLDPGRLADLTIAYRPTTYLRVTPLAFRATPLGTGHGQTRFASPDRTFTLLYIAEDLPTGLAETLVRDRFEGRIRRRLLRTEVGLWGATEVSALQPLALVDLRTTGLLQLGVSTDAGRAKAQRTGRRLSAEIHRRSGADGILYRLRLTGAICCAVYERARLKLTAGPVVDLLTLGALVPALDSLAVELVPAG